MAEPDRRHPDGPFERFDKALGAILSVSKPAVMAEEKRQQDQRKAERTARKERRAA